MARRVFFSFHYEGDIWRASQVRNSWVTKPHRQAAGFWDAAAWEAVRRRGGQAVRRWINAQLQGTSVTVVLIGQETARRRYVLYEIARSYHRGNGILGVYVHRCANAEGYTCNRGSNPFNEVYYVDNRGRRVYFSSLYPTYDWVTDDGYSNLTDWIEDAAWEAGR